jgi:membrane protease YdiL (CAAX protease family)
VRQKGARVTTSDVYLFVVTSLAIAGFFFLFKRRYIGFIDFWWWFAALILTLMTLAILSDRETLKKLLDDVRKDVAIKILYGTLSAVILYFIFFTGNLLSRLVITSAGLKISEIYEMRTGTSLLKIILLLVFIIGPGEELFWRGYLQRRYSQRFGRAAGYIISIVLYTLIHTGSGNKMLILSACVGGLFWGWMYMWKNSILLNVTSHALWDLAVFILFPFTGS